MARPEGADFLDRYVVAPNGALRAELAEIAIEVVDEGIVVIDQEDARAHSAASAFAARFAPSNAPSSADALSRLS